MQYICLVHHEEAKLNALSEAELAALVRECVAWVEDLKKEGHHVLSAGLQSLRSARTVRERNGKLAMTDGPFAETKEFLGGFTILNASNLDEAVRLASTLPAVRVASVEVRPVLEADAELTDPLDRKIRAAMSAARHP